jgi:feruloyl esterase
MQGHARKLEQGEAGSVGTTRRLFDKVSVAALVTASLAFSECRADDKSVGAVQTAVTCASLRGATIGEVTVTATRRIEAAGDNPAFCQVMGTRAPYLDIEVDLPDNWSGRLWQQGGGGFDGTIPSAFMPNAATGATDLNMALKTGRAIYAASNGGNRAHLPKQAAPMIWMSRTEDGAQSAADYAYAALGTTREFAKALALSFYGKLPSWRYFNGCSNGGRNAYIAAERWPNEYDGIVSGCETMSMAGQTAEWMTLGAIVGTPAALSSPQWDSVSRAAVAACDSLDGVTDGIIANNAACGFDPSVLQCGEPAASADAAVCLSAQQVQTVRKLSSDLKLSNGATIYAHYNWSPALAQTVPAYGILGGGFAQLATGDASWLTQASKQQSFNVDRDFPVFQSGLRRSGADHEINKIAAYVASGRKMISWHDGADNLLSPNDHIRNYMMMTNAARTMGLADPSTNTRFFVVPGGIHGQGAGLTEVNWFAAITAWVENDIAPSQLVYSSTDAATGQNRTLPVCQHPLYPRFNGTGDVNSATSYSCAMP